MLHLTSILKKTSYLIISVFHKCINLVMKLKIVANERTWHNWLALSNATSWMGIIVAQMSKISKVVGPKHNHMLRYKACICQGASIVILLIGTYRFFCEQRAIGGTGRRSPQWTLLAAGLLVLMVSWNYL